MQITYSLTEHCGHKHLIKCRCWGYRRSWMWTINGPDSVNTFKAHDEFVFVDNDDVVGDPVQICISKWSIWMSTLVQFTRRLRSPWKNDLINIKFV